MIHINLNNDLSHVVEQMARNLHKPVEGIINENLGKIMQHIIELDPQTEKNLNNYLLSSGETETTILAYAVKDFLQQHLKQKSLEQKLQAFKINLDGFQFNR